MLPSFYKSIPISCVSYAVPTACHFGDVGDVFAACASLETLFPSGVDLVLYKAEGRCREPMSEAKVERLKPLLLQQRYIRSVRYSEKPEGLVLDQWRDRGYHGKINLAEMFAENFGLTPPDKHKPWFTVDNPENVADVIVHRSPRYAGRNFPWRRIIRLYKHRMAFIGLAAEYESFTKSFGQVRYHPTADWLAAARAIAGSKLYIGNQSAPYWLALGLGKRTWCEQFRGSRHNCYWQRDGAYYDLLPKFPQVN